MKQLLKGLDNVYHNLFDKPQDPYLLSKYLSRNTIRTVFDVGANVGQTTARMLPIFPESTIYGFEPFPDSFHKYKERFNQNKKVVPINKALSNKVGNETLHVNKHHYTNSLLPTIPTNKRQFHGNDDQLTNVNKIKISTTTLDTFASENKINQIDLLKLDVQGSELLILEGATALLKKQKISLIYLEVSFTPVYKNQVLFFTLYEFLGLQGFRLANFFDLYSDQEMLIQGDALFVHRNRIFKDD
jgi:FkbM family methyltransferase